MPVKATYLFLAAAGGIALYSGIKGKGLASATRSILTGQQPSKAKSAHPIKGGTNYPCDDPAYAAAHPLECQGYASQIAAAAGTTPQQQIGTAAGIAKNKAIGHALALAYGWSTGSEWASLDALWTQESGWNNYAYNISSGATGIPQSLPYNKMPQPAWLPKQGGIASATAQIAWGLAYIKATYGDPNTAWGGYWTRGGWY